MSTSPEFPGWPQVLRELTAGEDLDSAATEAVLGQILEGSASDAQIAAFLAALRAKGESPEEVGGLVSAMLSAAEPLPLTDPQNTIDLVGTGGSKALPGGAFNVSTIASIVAAAAGATVCKHGNRMASSTSGSTDILEALGVAVELNGEQVAACVDQLGLGFAFARVFHPAMRFVGPVRSQLGIPTVFNILGPLSHPGRVGRQVIGTPDPNLVDLIARTLADRGVRAWVLNGSDGLDEITTTGSTTVVSVENGHLEHFTISPADLGIPLVSAEDISVGDPAQNASVAHRLLAGEGGPLADLVALNAAAALVVAGIAADLESALVESRRVMEDGSGAAKLSDLVDLTRELTAG